MALFFDEEIREHFTRAQEPITEALRIYEDLGDQRGAMGCLITLAYAHLTDFTRRGEAGRLEQIRRLRTNLKRMTTESERAVDEAHMLYSIHTFARSHLILDLALDRGREGYEAARAIGDRWLEFLCAGGLALTHLLLRETAEASAWLANAGSAALATPGPMIARRLESWRGLYAAQAEDPMSAIEHFERAIDLAVENRSVAGRCEGLALLAMEAAKLGEATGNAELLDRAERAAIETRKVASGLGEVAGELAWEAHAWAASALVASTKGDDAAATECAKSALVALSPRLMRAFHLDVYRIAGRILIGGGAPEAEDLKDSIGEMLFKLDNSLVDPGVKERWIKVPINSELVELADYHGFTSDPGIGAAPAAALEEIEIEIMRQLASGKSDAEIAEELDTDTEDVGNWFGSIFSKLDVDSKEEVTEYALTRGIV
jgi:DNA-binding CsgD family transcriptional regulator